MPARQAGSARSVVTRGEHPAQRYDDRGLQTTSLACCRLRGEMQGGK